MTEVHIEVLISLAAVFVATVCWAIVVLVLEVRNTLKIENDEADVNLKAIKHHYGFKEKT